MGARCDALDDCVLMAPLDPRYTQVGFNVISVQVCPSIECSDPSSMFTYLLQGKSKGFAFIRFKELPPQEKVLLTRHMIKDRSVFTMVIDWIPATLTFVKLIFFVKCHQRVEIL